MFPAAAAGDTPTAGGVADGPESSRDPVRPGPTHMVPLMGARGKRLSPTMHPIEAEYTAVHLLWRDAGRYTREVMRLGVTFRLKAAAGIAVIAALAGCAARFEAMDNPIEINGAEYPRLFDAAVVVLREQGFIVEQQDYRYGRITTRPATSPTFLEPWNTNKTTPDQAFASTISHQRRRISLFFQPWQTDAGPVGESLPVETEGAASTYEVRAEVLTERLVVPIARITGSTQPNSLIGRLRDVPAEWKERGIQGAYWRPVGRDSFLEQRLLAQIVRRSMRVEASAVSDER